jgi:hypothetical protein
MSAASNRTSVTHSIQEFLLIRARMFARQLDLDIQGPSVRNTVAENISLAVVADVHHATVFREELTDRVVTCYAAVFT